MGKLNETPLFDLDRFEINTYLQALSYYYAGINDFYDVRLENGSIILETVDDEGNESLTYLALESDRLKTLNDIEVTLQLILS